MQLIPANGYKIIRHWILDPRIDDLLALCIMMIDRLQNNGMMRRYNKV